MVVTPGVALAPAVGVLRAGEGVDDATEVGDDVAVAFVGVGDGMGVDVGVGVVTVVGVEVGVEVEVGEGVAEVVGVGEGLSAGTTVYFVTEYVANVALAAIAWVLMTTVIAPINESSNNVMESTPTNSLLGVSLVKKA